MKIIDDVEGFKNKTLTKCSKAKLEPILRAKNALENDFIDQMISEKHLTNVKNYMNQQKKKF